MTDQEKRRLPLRTELGTVTLRHWSISMVREPTKTLHSSVHGRFSVFSRRKLLHQIPRPDRFFMNDRIIHFAMPSRIVNAAN
jgi:hypothetical protein